MQVLPEYDSFASEPDAPGHDVPARAPKKKIKKKPAGAVGSPTWTVAFKDDFEGRNEVGKDYVIKSGKEDAWAVSNGVLVGMRR